MRPTWRAAATLVTATAVLVVAAACTPTTGTGGGSTTTTTVPAGLNHCPTPGAGQVRVAVVVDTTGLTGAATPSVVCVVVQSNATGATALVARAARIGNVAPRYNSSGLLCAIDGLPAAPVCGDPVSGGFAYWSYWLGGSTWTYATIGPASHGVFDGDVEGWRWVPSGTAAAPQFSSSFAALTS